MAVEEKENVRGEVTEVSVRPRSPDGFGALQGTESLLELKRTAARLRQTLGRRVIWNVNSTAAGGGVAEMLHSLLAYTRGLGVETRWAVIPGNADFFRITKRLHNALHGDRGDGTDLGGAEREIYENVSAHNAADLCKRVRADDFVILHDPQTAGLIPRLVDRGARVIWRCHIGGDAPSQESDRGWEFIAPYLDAAHAFVFSRFAYVPDCCDHGRSVIVAPSIDPFSPKNQDLDELTVEAILQRTGLIASGTRSGSAVFKRPDGSMGTVVRQAEVLREGPPPGPEASLVVQVSRWDRLKDHVGVLEGFEKLVRDAGPDGTHLILAGPSAAAVTDDPEGLATFDEIVQSWRRLPDEVRRRVQLANLPMDDLLENAAIVNALQRRASIVVQKSLREGFGLTVSEAMWKRRAVVASAVGGIQDQIEHGVSGLLIRNPSDLTAFVAALRQLLASPDLAQRLGRNARQRVTRHYLGMRALSQYADLFERLDASARA